jgi:DNA polymerase III epsilon subunit-like protein
MNYVSVDIETTGLNPDKCQILQVCAIIDNGGELNKLPRFDFKVRRDFYEGEPYAFAMHTRLLRQLAADHVSSDRKELNWNFYRDIGDEKAMVIAYRSWLAYHGVDLKHYNVAGKNFASFDRMFLRRIDEFPLGRHRIIEVGNLYLRVDDTAVPNTIECCKRAGIKIDKSRIHDALYDCEIVVRLVRAKFRTGPMDGTVDGAIDGRIA